MLKRIVQHPSLQVSTATAAVLGQSFRNAVYPASRRLFPFRFLTNPSLTAPALATFRHLVHPPRAFFPTPLIHGPFDIHRTFEEANKLGDPASRSSSSYFHRTSMGFKELLEPASPSIPNLVLQNYFVHYAPKMVRTEDFSPETFRRVGNLLRQKDCLDP